MTPDPSTAPTTEERLRQAAVELFSERGYGGTSMGEIASRIGVRKASLYNYYPSKADLLIDLLERSLATWKAACRSALEEPGPHADRLAKHLVAIMDFVVSRPHEVGMLRLAAGQVGGELGERVAALVAEHEAEYARRTEAFFAGAVASGEIEPAEPASLALLWKAVLDGMLLNQILRPTGRDRYRDRLGELWTLIWRGLGGVRAPELTEVS